MNKVLTREDIKYCIGSKLGMTSRESAVTVESFLETICGFFVDGKNMKLSTFGDFKLNDKAARPGRNPMTGKECEITSRRALTFSACIKTKKFINNNAL